MPRTVDAHHHLWRFMPQEFDWLEGALVPLRRDFLVPDLKEAMHTAGIDMTIAIQARQTLEETRWLLELAAVNAEIAGVVGWLPLTSKELPELLATQSNPLLKGLRHVLQGERDPDYMLRDDFNRGIATLGQAGLVYDILIFEQHLPQTILFVDRHPNQAFVLDHGAKPRIADSLLEPWAKNMHELARRPNVYCKLSGLVTEADPLSWTRMEFAPYLNTIVEAFGPMRLLAGSDWPVCLAGIAYADWFQLLQDFFRDYTNWERAALFGETAMKVYSLS